MRGIRLVAMLTALLLWGTQGGVAQDTTSVDGSPMSRADAARTGATVEPGPTGPVEILWQARTGGGPTPAVAGGVIYAPGHAGVLFALDAVTGEEIWTARYSPSLSAPAVADGFVVVGSREGLIAFAVATGEEHWRFVPEGEPVAGVPREHFDSSPAIVDGVVYVGDGPIGGLYAVDLATGALRWRFQATGATLSSPAVADGVVYVGTIPDEQYGHGDQPAALIAVDAVTGEERWRFEPGGEHTLIASAPAVVAGTIFVNSVSYPEPAPPDLMLHALDAATGAEQWRIEVGNRINFTNSPAVANGLVYISTGADNALLAVDAATGEERWRTPTEQLMDSPSVAADAVYVSAADGYIHAVDAVTGEECWRVMVNGFTSAPAIAGGMVYVHSWEDGNLYAIGDAAPAASSD
jgi:outer membrane protein assembly factor BamB